MIASLAEEPLQKVTLNLFKEDYLEFKAIYGDGWSTEIRRLVRRHLKELKNMSQRRSLDDSA
jgi:hypothetical protein